MPDYTLELARLPRDSAREFAKTLPFEKYPLVYRAGRYREPLTGLTQKCVDATCGRCGAAMKLAYYAGQNIGAPFGFWDHGSGKAYGTGDKLNCPECGRKVMAVHVGSVSAWGRSWSWIMEPLRVRYKPGLDALLLMFWRVYRAFDKQAQLILEIEPYEAYAVEEDRIVCMKHWQKLYYNTTCNTSWRTLKAFSDTIYDVYSGEILGDLHGAMLGTTAENSKLDLYMAQAETPFPVSYLRIWQKHPNVETLLTCGAGKLLGALIEEGKKNPRAYYTPAWTNSAPALPLPDWKAKRPNEILRMDRAELRAVLAAGLSGTAVETLLECRKYGVPVRLPEDIPAIKGCDLKRWQRVIRLGVRWDRAQRYLDAQKRRYPKEDAPSPDFLADYWDMARDEGWDLSDRDLRWPGHLRSMHDQLMVRKKFKEDAKLVKKFERRAAALGRYRFEADGFLVTQPLCESDLIREGKLLNHCVATYARSHANGSTTILFIRRAEAPELPFYTLNIDEKTMSVRQDLGKNNRQTTPEVKAFEALFMQWVRAGCKRDKDGAPIVPGRRKRGAA